MASSSRYTLILTDSNDWEPWIKLIKVAALEHDIWKYIDPSLPRAVFPIAPARPTPSQVRSNTSDSTPASSSTSPSTTTQAVTFADLTIDERDQLRWLKADYDDNNRVYRKEVEALGKIRLRIQESVDRKNFVYTSGDSAYEVLNTLKARFKPADYVKTRELHATWLSLQNSTKVMDTE
jgi:hypothetical protein